MDNNLLSIEDYRNNPEFYFSKGLRCANKRNLNDAYKYLMKASALEPDNTEYSFNMACFLSEMKRPREANRIFLDILQNYDPKLYDCYFGLGCNYFEIGDTKKSAEYFDKYLYFDSEGEFSEEVSEMLFYIKLYNDISHNNKFLKQSKNYLTEAWRLIEKNDENSAVAKLYNAITANPANIEARNLLTFYLLKQGKYIKASYINNAALCFEEDNVWANCLKAYILQSQKKHKPADKQIVKLASIEPQSREDVLCIATTLILFNRIPQLVLFLQKHIVNYCDAFIFATLLIGCIALGNNEEKSRDLKRLISVGKSNCQLTEWIDTLDDNINVLNEYKKVFVLCGESNHPQFSPQQSELLSVKEISRKAIDKSYLPVIKCCLEHKEIMYTKQYEREIIDILNNYLENTNCKMYIDISELSTCACFLEYIYCMQNFIDITKKELADKYNISLIMLNKTIKALEYYQDKMK